GDVQPALIARALTLAVPQSGLFYESHLRDLAFGGRTAAQLKLEPRGQLGNPSASTVSSTSLTSLASGTQSGAQSAVAPGSGHSGAPASEGAADTRGTPTAASPSSPGH